MKIDFFHRAFAALSPDPAIAPRNETEGYNFEVPPISESRAHST
jgi:hypothetical protein